jgi:hypothetical protein
VNLPFLPRLPLPLILLPPFFLPWAMLYFTPFRVANQSFCRDVPAKADVTPVYVDRFSRPLLPSFIFHPYELVVCTFASRISTVALPAFALARTRPRPFALLDLVVVVGTQLLNILKHHAKYRIDLISGFLMHMIWVGVG